MSPLAVIVSPNDTLASAIHAMMVHRIRQLVVCEEGRIAGILTQSDAFSAQTHPATVNDELRVIDAMIPFVYVVEPDALLEEVVRGMADAKYSAAVILEGGRPVGILTTTDALRVLADVLVEARQKAPTLRLAPKAGSDR